MMRSEQLSKIVRIGRPDHCRRTIQRLGDDERVDSCCGSGGTQQLTCSAGDLLGQRMTRLRLGQHQVDRSVAWPVTSDGLGNHNRGNAKLCSAGTSCVDESL